MKITNLKMEMFNWKSEPWMTGVGTQFGSTQQLGVVTVETDEGVSGNSFLGSSRMGADHFALGLIEFIKPIVMGRNPLDIGAIWADMYKMNRSVSTYVIAAVDVCLWDINGKLAGQPIHRLLGTCKDSVPSTPAPPTGRPRRSTSKRPSDSGTWAGPPTRFTRTATPPTTSRSARPSPAPSETT